MNLLHLNQRESRAPETEVLPDGRKRLTRFFEVATNLVIPPELDLAYGTEDAGAGPAGWTGFRLTNKKLTDELPPKGKDSRPVLQLIFEQIDASAETAVGGTPKSFEQDGRGVLINDFIQFSSATATPGTVGVTPAPSDGSYYLQKEEVTDNGTIRSIKRTFVNAGTIATDLETKNNGALLIQTITSVITVPSTPSGYTLIGQPVQFPGGLPVYTYTFAKGAGQISLEIEVSESNDAGTTGVTKATVRYLVAPAATLQPTSAPISPSVLIDYRYEDLDGHRMWTTVWARGQGIVVRDQETKEGGKLILYHFTSLDAIPNAPSPTIGGTVVLVTANRKLTDGYYIYDYTWAEGFGEMSRTTEYRLSPDLGTTGMTVTTIKYLTASSVGSDPTTGPGSSVKISCEYADQDGFRVWTSSYASGTGTVTSTIEYRNKGKLVIYSKTAINSAPSAPSPTIGGTVVLIKSEARNGTRFEEGAVIYDYSWAEGEGAIEKRTQERPGGLKLETWVSLGTAYDGSFMLPAGILMAKDSDDRDGHTVWTVTCIQNSAGASPLLGGSVASFRMVSPGNYDYGSVPAVTITGGTGGGDASATAVLASTSTVFSVALTGQGIIGEGSGYGYGSVPTVGFSGGGGSGAAATAALGTGTVVSGISLGAGGVYATNPTVTITGGGGTGATATTFLPDPTVKTITVTAGGSGYSSTPTVTITGGSPFNTALATAALTGGAVSSITVTYGGYGYNSTPTVTITGGGGTGATATALLSRDAVASVTLAGAVGPEVGYGFGYGSTPTVGFSGGGGSGAAGTAVMGGGSSVAGFSVTAGGGSYTSNPTVTITGGGGTGATATAGRSGTVVNQITLTNPGSGYTSTPTVTISGGGGTGATADAYRNNTAVASITITNPGSGYTSNPSVSITGGSPLSSASGTAVRGEAVTSLGMTGAGTGYSSTPTVTISGGSGAGATGTAYLSNTTVKTITVTNPGSGYTSAPTVTFTGGSPVSAASATATIAKALATVTVNYGGTGYSSAPTVTLTGGGGTGATATAALTSGAVSSITVTAGGTGYSSAPLVTLTGGVGGGATATAVLSGGTTGFVTSLTLTAAGSGYVAAPTVTIGTPTDDTPQFAAVLTGVALSHEKLLSFTYPGRAQAVNLAHPDVANSHNLDIQLSPPIEQILIGTEDISYTTENTIGNLANSLWNPKEWATVFAQFVNTSLASVSRMEGLRGYRAIGGVSSVTQAPTGGQLISCLGSEVGYIAAKSAYLKVFGGPDSPDNETFTLEASCELAFIGFDGTKYFRRMVAYASIPPQPAMPVLTSVAMISSSVTSIATLKAVATVGVTVGGRTNAFRYQWTQGGVGFTALVRGTLTAGTLSADATFAIKPTDYNGTVYWVLTAM